MTEAIWDRSSDPNAMLASITGHAADRKMRLLLIGILRVSNEYFQNSHCEAVIEAGELYADDKCDLNALSAPHTSLIRYLFGTNDTSDAAFGTLRESDRNFCNLALGASRRRVDVPTLLKSSSWRDGSRIAGLQLPDLIRCIIGNPFRPVELDPSWRTEAVVGLAAGIYADRAFDRLPVLADALEDAGCADPDVLGHCRSGGPHARGCWVVDLVLGKA